MKALAIISTFWAAGAAVLFFLASRESYGWTAYAPLAGNPAPALGNEPLVLVAAWLTVMLTISAVGAWITVLIRLLQRRRTLSKGGGHS